MAGFARAVIRAQVGHGFAELVGDPDRPRGWTLLVDGTAQSHVDLDDPTHLEFEYVRRLGHVVDLLAPPTEPLRVLHLGGGAWTLARYVAATRPGSVQQVVELDGELADLVGARLPADDPGLEVTVGDARAALASAAPASWDLVVLDVFAGARTPAHVTTVEFLRLAAAALADGGVYAANVADGDALVFARGQVAAAREVFAHVAVIVAADVLHGRRFGNLVLVASQDPLPEQELARRAAADPFRASVLDGRRARRFAGGAAPPLDRGARPSPVPPAGFFGQ
ncbi:spermidine synthase [Pseudonocardia sp. CA-107938]|uniref:spermidine synthase n=1 Tax=Pseudonocardia sp. CA-107938 TaxID=3240021 RepID=UPI003D93B7EC